MLENSIYGVLEIMLITSYTGILVFLFLENTIFPFLPAELVLLFAGILVYLNQMDFTLLLLASTVGSTLGAWVLYEIGRRHARTFVKKYGKYVLMKEKHLEESRRWFSYHGGKAVFFGRFIGGMRHLISLPAGDSGMKQSLFLTYTFLGNLAWNAIIIWIGVFLGKNWEKLSGSLQWLEVIATTAFLMFAGWLLYKLSVHRATRSG